MLDASKLDEKTSRFITDEESGTLSSSTIPTTSPRLPTPHSTAGRYTTHNALFRNSIIGFADGLTVPFALTAGLSTLGSSRLVILGGLAELSSGAISMGVGAYLAASAQHKQYTMQRLRLSRDLDLVPAKNEMMAREILAKYGIGEGVSREVVQQLSHDADMLVQFIIDFDLHLESPDTKMALVEGVVMGFSYCIGGLLPMIPYFATPDTRIALYTSIGITAVVLVAFGYVKTWVAGTTHRDSLLGAVQMLIVGAAAVAAAYGIAKAVNHTEMQPMGS